MTGSAFNRKYRLFVSQKGVAEPPKQGEVLTDAYMGSGVDSEDLRSIRETGDTVLIDELQMTADIRIDIGSGDSNEQTSIISVHNLSNETAARISSKGSQVVLEAGYESDGPQLPIIFTGNVEKSITRFSGTDKITQLFCRAASGITSSVRKVKQLDESEDTSVSGKTYKDAFLEVIEMFKQNGVATSSTSINLDFSGNIQLKPPAETRLRGGFATDGYIMDSMNLLCGMFGFTWYIMGGVLYVQPYRFKEYRSFYEIDPTAIKSIEPLEDQGTKSQTDQNTISGVRLRLFLDGEIRPDLIIRVPSLKTLRGAYEFGTGDLSGDYVVAKMNHELDYLNGSWDVIIECTSATKKASTSEDTSPSTDVG